MWVYKRLDYRLELYGGSLCDGERVSAGENFEPFIPFSIFLGSDKHK
jgi:hypothetical protein